MSIASGGFVGFLTGATTGKLVETVALTFIGGFIGAAGGTVWRWIRRRYLQKKETKNNNESGN